MHYSAYSCPPRRARTLGSRGQDRGNCAGAGRDRRRLSRPVGPCTRAVGRGTGGRYADARAHADPRGSHWRWLGGRTGDVTQARLLGHVDRERPPLAAAKHSGRSSARTAAHGWNGSHFSASCPAEEPPSQSRRLAPRTRCVREPLIVWLSEQPPSLFAARCADRRSSRSSLRALPHSPPRSTFHSVCFRRSERPRRDRCHTCTTNASCRRR